MRDIPFLRLPVLPFTSLWYGREGLRACMLQLHRLEKVWLQTGGGGQTGLASERTASQRKKVRGEDERGLYCMYALDKILGRSRDRDQFEVRSTVCTCIPSTRFDYMYLMQRTEPVQCPSCLLLRLPSSYPSPRHRLVLGYRFVIKLGIVSDDHESRKLLDVHRDYGWKCCAALSRLCITIDRS